MSAGDGKLRARCFGAAAGTVTKKAAGTAGKAAGSVGSAAGTVTKAAGAEVGIVVTWLAMMLALETSVILKWRKQLAIMAGVGLASATLAVSSPWSRPLDLWRLLVKMGAGGAATAATAVAAGVTAGIAASGLFGIWRGLRRATGAEFAAPMPRQHRVWGSCVVTRRDGWWPSSRTVALAPT